VDGLTEGRVVMLLARKVPKLFDVDFVDWEETALFLGEMTRAVWQK
jgi:hypothetical protein